MAQQKYMHLCSWIITITGWVDLMLVINASPTTTHPTLSVSTCGFQSSYKSSASFIITRARRQLTIARVRTPVPQSVVPITPVVTPAETPTETHFSFSDLLTSHFPNQFCTPRELYYSKTQSWGSCIY
eukprot:4801003-Ditylum_brightwellii.AAC.1